MQEVLHTDSRTLKTEGDIHSISSRVHGNCKFNFEIE
jgi:hypothetical protein